MGELKPAMQFNARTFSARFISGRTKTQPITQQTAGSAPRFDVLYCECVSAYVQNVHYVSANENNEKSMFERLAKDYYHLDNKWCCCYEIKCSHNRMESSAKQK